MRILAIADVESQYLYDFYSPDKLKGIDLIIACGDLNPEYLEFLVTMTNVPLLYVHGNHDDKFKREPEGCICIDGKYYEYGGVRFVGLGGAYCYKPGKYMYSERDMRQRINKLYLKIRRHRGFDVLVTHAPARHLNDFDNRTHRGFDCFNNLLERFRPALFLHGHIHLNYGVNIPRRTEHDGTLVINAADHFIFDYDFEKRKAD